MTGRLAGKTAFITGAARGIGRAQAVRFAEEGADIIGVDVCGPSNRSRSTQHAETISTRPRAWSSSTVGGSPPTSSMFAIWTHLRAPPTAVSTASVGSTSSVLQRESRPRPAPRDDRIDVADHAGRQPHRGVAHLYGRGSASDRRGAGSIVLVSSIAGLRGLVGVAHYTAAKHGVVGLMRSLANDLAPHGVRVNSVHPTNVDTPMIQNAVGAQRVPPRPGVGPPTGRSSPRPRPR